MKLDTKHFLLFLGLVVLAFSIRWSVAIGWQSRLQDGQEFVFPDSHSYWYLADRLASGEPYEYGGPDFRVFRAPGYPLFLAAILRHAPRPVPVIWLRVAGAVLGALVVAEVMLLGRLLFDGRTSFVAGLMATFYPGAIGMSVFVLSEALFCPLMVAQLIAWTVAWRSSSTVSKQTAAISTGVLAGLATLTRPSWLLFTPFAIGLAITFSSQRRRHVSLSLTIMFAMCVTMTPWWIRNYQATGQFVPTTLQVGASLYDGLNPHATGGSDMRFAKVFYEQLKHEDEQHGEHESVFEVRLNNRLRDAAVSWAREHPAAVAQLMVTKFFRMWGVWPHANELQHRLMRWLIAAGYVPLLACIFVGAWLFARRGWPYVVCLVPAAYFTGLHLIFVSSIRYRQPAILAAIVLAAGAVVFLLWPLSHRSADADPLAK
jgi:4-amino-4-deoxy-L-arabinose transferase-like glycosyltransferase